MKKAGEINWGKARLRVSYPASDPSHTVLAGTAEKPYHQAQGIFRLWTQDGKKKRKPEAVDAKGDWIAAKEYAAKLLIDPREKTNTWYAEGIQEGGYEGDIAVEFDPLGTGEWLKDKARVTVVHGDVDVDSDNDNGFNPPKRDRYEDRIEAAPLKFRGRSYPGKLIPLNDGDVDLDGVPDWGDGFDADPQVPADDAISTNVPLFVPIVFDLPAPLDPNKVRVRLRYSASDPREVRRLPTGVYVLPPQGELRVWRTNEWARRDKRSALENGDYVAPGVYEGGAPLRRWFRNGRTVTCWLEAVRLARGAKIHMDVDPDGTNGPAAWVHEDCVKVSVLKVDLDIRETAQPQNRVGRDDPRPDLPAHARNRILVWANSGANTVTFDLIKPPDISGPVWVQIEDLTGLNSGMPHFERLDAASATFTYTVADDNDDADLLVRYGADLNSDGTLAGTDEIKGTYEVYGVTAEDYAESRNNYNWFYLWTVTKMADQLHKRFANGAFQTPGDYVPTSTSGSATLSANRFTHDFGASFSDAGFVDVGGRKYYAATAAVPIYHYADNSPGSELIRESDALKNGLDAFVGNISYTTVAAAYAAAPGGVTRSVTFSLNGASFQFGGTGGIGLGGVGVNSAEPYSSAGNITLQVTQNGSNYDIGPDATTDLTLHDLFDFDYFTTTWIPDHTDATRSAAMIQSGFGKPGSVTNAGQVGLVEVEVDGAVTISERTIAP